MTFDGGWELSHVKERKYLLANCLEYDAKRVKIVAVTRTAGKPDAIPGSIEKLLIGEYASVPAGSGVMITLDPRWQDAPLPFELQIDWNDEFGATFVAAPQVPSPSSGSRQVTRPDLRSPVPPGFVTAASRTSTRGAKRSENVRPSEYADPVPDADPRTVFVVVGRNTEANKSMFDFLRALDLRPLEWSKAIAATGSASPYIGEALEAAFKKAQAVVVFMTPDDIARLRPEYAYGDDDPELKPLPQARPNVLFEAGMALGLHPNRTVLVELGSLRPFSDVAGRHAVRIDNSPEKRNELATRLKNAGCPVDTSGTAWYEAGDFTAPKAPSGLGRRLPSNTKPRTKYLDASFMRRSSGSDRIQIINRGTVDLFDLVSPNVKDLPGVVRGFPIARLPAGKSVSLMTLRAAGAPDTFDLEVQGRTEDGEEVNETLFLDLNR